MNILLTNDDGYLAEGLKILKDVLQKKHKIFIFAPESQKSGASHSISLFSDIKVKKFGKNQFYVCGTPADCILIAENYLKDKYKIDLVISGINHGQNVGDDIYYSGTFGAAREAMFSGKKAIAVSIFTNSSTYDYHFAASKISDFLDVGLTNYISKDELLNINFPAVESKKIKGIIITHLGKRKYTNFVSRDVKFSKDMFFYIGAEDMKFVLDPESDVNATTDGYISITPISKASTSTSTSIELNKWLKKCLK